MLIENVVNIFFVTSLSVSLHNRLGKYIFIKQICTTTYYSQQGWKAVILENIHLIVSILYFTLLRHIAWCFFTLDMIFLNGKAYATLCSSPTLLLFYSFTIVPQLYCCSPSLLLFSIFTVVLQLYYCFPALLLFYSFTVVL